MGALLIRCLSKSLAHLLILSLGLTQVASIAIGKSAGVTEFFPYQAFLATENATIFCGGVVLDPYLILTTAHCFDGNIRIQNQIQVIAGITNGFYEFEGAAQVRRASAFHIHEEYDWITQSNDIALVEVKTPFHFTSAVNKINLPRFHETFQGNVTIIRHGNPEKAMEGFLALKNHSRSVVLDVICKGVWNPKGHKSVFCVEDLEPGLCEKDTGSPAICTRLEYLESVLCGIAASDRKCGEDQIKNGNGIPRPYTKVSNYVDWIENKMKRTFERMKCNRDHFYCRFDRKCLPRRLVCDSKPSCRGTEYQGTCVTFNYCGTDEFSCNNGKCLNSKEKYLCNGKMECDDGSDEDKCMDVEDCEGLGLHYCGKQDRCIPMDWKCDGLVDCNDESDERGCSSNSTAEIEISGAAQIPITYSTPSFMEKGNATEQKKPGKIRQWWNKFKNDVKIYFMFHGING